MSKLVRRFIQWLLLVIMVLCRMLQTLERRVLELEKEKHDKDRQIRKKSAQLRKSQASCSRLHRENTGLRRVSRTVMSELDKSKAEASSQKAENRRFRKELTEAEAERRKMNDVIAHLQNRLNKNSQNSSNPPSTDPVGQKAANEYNGRTATGRTPGGQPGKREHYEALSKEEALELLKNPETKHIVLNRGPVESGDFKSRYAIDMKLIPVVTETRYYRDDPTKGYGIPAALRSPVVYGDNLRALAAELYTNGVMSNQRIHDLLGQLGSHQFDVSEGSVYNFVRSVSSACAAPYEDIQTVLTGERVLYTDATVLSKSGELVYLRYIGTKDLGYFVPMDSKSIEALQAIDLLADFLGILVHDHETALYHFGSAHAECNVHVLRYLRKAGEETGHPWISAMADLLLRGKKLKDESGKHKVTDEEYAELSSLYDGILTDGFEQNKTVELDSIRANEKALLNRMRKYKKEHLLFLTDPEVDFSNNLSERSLRPGKLRQKMSGGFRKDSGLEMYCRLLTVEHYCRQHQLNSMQVFEDLLKGKQLKISKTRSAA